jgi:hypothetical protein
MESNGGIILTGKTEELWENTSSVNFLQQIPHERAPSANPGLHGKRPATNRHETANLSNLDTGPELRY